MFSFLCLGRESNPHPRRDSILSAACIPIPPPRHFSYFILFFKILNFFEAMVGIFFLQFVRIVPSIHDILTNFPQNLRLFLNPTAKKFRANPTRDIFWRKFLRPWWDLHPRITVLQTVVLTTSPHGHCYGFLYSTIIGIVRQFFGDFFLHNLIQNLRRE